MDTSYRKTPDAVRRNFAVSMLQRHPAFQMVSRRLLADMVDQVPVEHGDYVYEKRAAGDLTLLIVVQGPLSVSRDGDPNAAAVTLYSGVYWTEDAPLNQLGGGGPFAFVGLGQRSAYLLRIDRDRLDAFVHASPALGCIPEVRKRLGEDQPAVRTETIWMALKAGLRAPLEALTEILAAAVGTQFEEPSAVVKIFDERFELHVWNRDSLSFSAPVTFATSRQEIVDAFVESVGRPDEWHHLFFVRPDDPLRRPEALMGERFHRIVYVTDVAPGEVPPGVESLLWKDLHPSEDDGDDARWGTYFSSFVPSILVPPPNRALPSSILGTLASIVPWPSSGFRALPIDDLTPTDPKSGGKPTRLQKDHCRIGFDIDALSNAWRSRSDASTFPTRVFFDPASGAETACKKTADRWARAVTNRRIGLALSGGGVHAFRVVPLLDMLRKRNIPIDLFASMSGGAVVGAYYCKDDLAGLKLARDRGWPFFLASTASYFWSVFLERQVDFDLGGARVEELETMFLAVTTSLGDPPAASVVVSGTLGEAVRASGTALFAYGPTAKGALHYLDGATATMVPAKVLTDNGADLVLACNCVPPPKYGNPYGGSLLGRLAHMLPIVDRVIDGTVGLNYLLTTASRVASSDAHVYWEPLPTENPIVQASCFMRAKSVVEESRQRDGEPMQQAVNRLDALWKKLGKAVGA